MKSGTTQARSGAIEITDLLTTSPTPGHAMKAHAPLAAFSAVIGKDGLISINGGSAIETKRKR